MRLGAFDFVVKPVSPERLRITVRNAAERRRLSSALDAVRDEIGREGFCGFIGRSLAMQTVYHIIQSAARSTATIFVTGESGTGKELCAEAVHRMSRRSQGPFVPINCAAIPQDLLESELFGHVKGAYTGATSDRQGAAMRAHGGTLFLDEIGEMRPEFQAKMLRFLQTGTVQRVGEDKVHAVDVRIVCATNRDPQAEVAAGRFREDLYYRLHVVPIELPPLRERDDDALLLARHFLKRYADEDCANVTGFTSDAEEALLRYRWPGNIRELQNVVRHVVVLSKGGAAGLDSLPGPVRSAMDAQRPAHSRVRGGEPQLDTSEASAAIQPLEETIEQAIERAIRLSEGSIPRAAAALKVSPSTIYRRLQSRATA
jgi:two-component system repressor protein LuxO